MKLIYTLDNIKSTVRKALSFTSHNVICFYGDLGVGKTTFIKHLLLFIEAADSGSSPSYGLVNEYRNVSGDVIAYHFDFYRIENSEEVFDIGFEDYLNSEIHVFIEWPEKISELLPIPRTEFHFNMIDEERRELIIKNVSDG